MLFNKVYSSKKKKKKKKKIISYIEYVIQLILNMTIITSFFYITNCIIIINISYFKKFKNLLIFIKNKLLYLIIFVNSMEYIDISNLKLN